MTRAALVAMLVAAVACGGRAPVAIVQLAHSGDGRWLALAQADGCVEVRELAGPLRRTVRVGAERPLRIALTEDGSRLAVVSGAEASVFTVATGRSSASAVSSPLKPSTSRSTKTVRKVSGNIATACSSSRRICSRASATSGGRASEPRMNASL